MQKINFIKAILLSSFEKMFSSPWAVKSNIDSLAEANIQSAKA